MHLTRPEDLKLQPVRVGALMGEIQPLIDAEARKKAAIRAVVAHEDLAFAVLHPKRYAEIEQLVMTQAPERGTYLDEVLVELRDRLAELHIEAEVQGRPKHYWSIYEKMVVKGKEFDEVFDLVGVRVVVDSVKDCYGALGTIHAVWRPVGERGASPPGINSSSLAIRWNWTLLSASPSHAPLGL